VGGVLDYVKVDHCGVGVFGSLLVNVKVDMIGVWEFRASVAIVKIGEVQLEVTNVHVHWAPRKTSRTLLEVVV
jgi:hypothetical protein